MNTSSMITMIITIYNKEEYLQQCLNSIFDASMQPKDLILINDGSTDGCSQILSSFQSCYQEIICVSHENRGVSACRNEGVALVKTPYFLFVDADDLIDQLLIQRLDELVQIECFDLISFNYNKITKDHTPLSHQHKPFTNKHDGPSVLTAFIKSKATFDSACTYLYNTAEFKDHDFHFASGRLHEDFGLIPWVILNAQSILCINDVLYYNIMSPNSIMRTNDYAKEVEKANDVLFHVVNLLKQLDQSAYDQDTKEIFVTYLVHTVISKLDRLNRKDQAIMINQIRQNDLLKGLPSLGWRKKIKNLLIQVSPKLYLRMTHLRRWEK